MKKVLLLAAGICFSVFTFAQDAAEKINQAQEAMKAKDYVKAFTLYDEAMSNLGDVQVDVSVNFNIGYAACQAGNVEGAEKYMAKAIEAKVKVPDCYTNLAEMYTDKKDYAKAVENFEKAIAAGSTSADALTFKAGSAAYNGKDFDKAVALFDKCIQANFKGETAYYYKSVILKNQKKDAESKTALEEGLAKFPGDAKMAPALAKVYVTEGNELYKKGAAIISEANTKVTAGKLKTDDPAYASEVGKAKVEFESAIAVLEKAKALDASNANVQKLLDACAAAMK
jgi:tetratricopeptide (TPR) repeat protein